MSKMYICVLDEFPDYMVPTLVAHSVLGAHLNFIRTHTEFSRIVDDGPYIYPQYIDWLKNSFKKCVVRVNQREFDKISSLENVYIGHENKTLDGRESCVVVCPYEKDEDIPNVLKFAKLWKPKQEIN